MTATYPPIRPTQLTDGLGNPLSVAAFHASDNAQPGGTSTGLLTGGVAQLVNPAGNLDRQRETGGDVIPNIGVATGTQQLAWAATCGPVTSGGIIGGTAPQTITLTAVTGVVNGVAWALQAGQSLVLEPNTATQEVFVVSSLNAAAHTVTGVIQKNHSASAAIVAFYYDQARSAMIPDGSTGQGVSAGGTYLYNSSLNGGSGGWEAERSAKGELDGSSGAGTNIAAEYEWNAGGPVLASGLASGFAFDRARNIQGKALGAGAITASVVGNTSIVLGSAAATGTIQPGQKIRLRGGAVKETVYVTASWVPGSSATVPVQSPVVNAGQTIAEWDVYGTSGPGLSGFLADGIGIEEEALYDPVTDLFYLERAATQDAMPPQNIVVENLGLYNGSTMDRARSGLLDLQSSIGIQNIGPMLYDGLNSVYNRLRQAPGAMGVPSVNTEGTKATYTANVLISGLTASGDILVIQGSGTKTVRILRVEMAATIGAAQTVVVALFKRSSNPGTGGVITALDSGNPLPHDANDAAATAAFTAYSTPPTAGTTTGVIRRSLAAWTPNTASAVAPWVADFTRNNEKAPVLRGTGQYLALNISPAGALASNLITVSVTFTEE